MGQKNNIEPQIPPCYKSIETLKIFHFMKVISTSDVRFIIKDVDVDNLPECDEWQLSKLNEIFDTILKQYIDETGKRDIESNIFKLQRQAESLKSKYELIKMYCFILHNLTFDQDAIDELALLGYQINPANYKEDADKAKKKAGKLLTEANIKIKEAEVMKPKTEQSKQSLEEVAFAMEVKTGVRQDTKQLTVKDWIIRENNFLKQPANGSD